MWGLGVADEKWAVAASSSDGETRTRTGPDGVPGHGHGCRHRELMARPGLEPVRTAFPVMGMDAVTAS